MIAPIYLLPRGQVEARPCFCEVLLPPPLSCVPWLLRLHVPLPVLVAEVALVAYLPHN
jgi:hypothetical protein